MTAEQILEKHLLSMLKRTEQSYVAVDEMKKQPEWQATINAMIEYGEMQSLCIHDVVGQNEQLNVSFNVGDKVIFDNKKAIVLWVSVNYLDIEIAGTNKILQGVHTSKVLPR